MSRWPRRSAADALDEARSEIDRVDPSGAECLVARGGILVDIRPVELRHRDGVIPGSWVVDRNVLEWRLDPLSDAHLPDVDAGMYERAVVVVCDEGYASSLAARDLRRLGIDGAVDLVGGFQAWRASGRPVRAGGSGPDRSG